MQFETYSHSTLFNRFWCKISVPLHNYSGLAAELRFPSLQHLQSCKSHNKDLKFTTGGIQKENSFTLSDLSPVSFKDIIKEPFSQQILMPQLLSFVSRAGSACAPWHPFKAGRWPKMDEYFPHFVSTSNNPWAFGPNHFSSCISPTWILWSQAIFPGNRDRAYHPWVDYWGPARSFGEPQKLFYNFAITFATQPSQDASDPGSPRASLLLLITEAPCAPLPAAKLPLPDLLSLVSTRAASQCAHEYSRVTSSDARTWRTLHSRSRMLECWRCFWRFLLLKREDDEKRSSWALKTVWKWQRYAAEENRWHHNFPPSPVESSHVFRSPFNISTPRFPTHKSYVSQTSWQQDGMDFEDSKLHLYIVGKKPLDSTPNHVSKLHPTISCITFQAQDLEAPHAVVLLPAPLSPSYEISRCGGNTKGAHSFFSI